MADFVIIQYRTEGGQWSNYWTGVLNEGGRVYDAMIACQQNTNAQVRAVDHDGRVVDYLG